MSDWQVALNLHWYDRNPKAIWKTYEAAKAPHGDTERWKYEVPTDKKAYMEMAHLWVCRGTAAGTVGYANSYVTYQPKGGSSAFLVLAQLHSNTVGEKNTKNFSVVFTMLEGDVLKGFTSDGSDGGQCIFFNNIKITEFDAEPPKAFLFVRDPTPKPDIQVPGIIDPKM